MPGSSTRKLLIDNRKARFEYEILETYSAGLALLGSEVKAIRAGRANLTDAFARIQAGEVLLYNMHISPLQTAGAFAHDPLRTRKLLLKRREINKLTGRVEEKGLTLVPLKLYLEGSWIKLDLGLARGKKLYDKREDVKKREAKRDMERALRR
ncbi:SsrA-binding protein SmpB [Gloeobacter kilaueensis]|uniref:SsrA-binding protein n=1 Tax=Gloeobacter kilaueensis (strain ATCC BAA-2537 / CCAP 1431/1 / ULC 316 / JS1) TaxID=1183438 RepID=U5QNX2_GLOK1|nr:SsrA-binding protein SmpB [Gloeobacter kilaueensis]AGY59330.1 SsrA-binding protein [Gloeobacter kilaueensis JS1]